MSCSGLHCAGCGAGASVPPVALAAVFGLAWIAEHLIEVAVVSAACGVLAVAAVVALMRQQERREAARAARGTLFVTRAGAAPVPPPGRRELPGEQRAAIGPVYNFNFYGPAGDAHAAVIRKAITGQAGDLPRRHVVLTRANHPGWPGVISTPQIPQGRTSVSYDHGPRRPYFAPHQPQPAPQYPPYGQESYPAPWPQQAPPPRRRRKRRVFPWVFLAIQALFIIWLVTGLATTHAGPTQAQLAQGCYDHNWWPLFKSQADCVQHYGGALTDAGNAGKAIGAGIIVALWVAVDVILGIGYGIWRLARR